VQANASKRKAMSHERMHKAEKQLEQEINALMRKAEILDAQEDHRYGKGKLGSELPDELKRRQDRLARIRQARKEMEADSGDRSSCSTSTAGGSRGGQGQSRCSRGIGCSGRGAVRAEQESRSDRGQGRSRTGEGERSCRGCRPGTSGSGAPGL
jgi:hypothetical protein